MNKFALLRSILITLAGALLPSLVFAHTDVSHAGIGDTSSFMHGLTHPASSLDHVCAMLAAGLWAAQMGGRSVWAVPLTFVSVMALGGILPVLGISLPFVEQGIVLSVLLLGVLIVAQVRFPLWLGGTLVGLFALWHGHAHGAEMPASAVGLFYGLGFALTTTWLHVAGVALGLRMQQLVSVRAVRFTGFGIVLCGAYLVAA